MRSTAAAELAPSHENSDVYSYLVHANLGMTVFGTLAAAVAFCLVLRIHRNKQRLEPQPRYLLLGLAILVFSCILMIGAWLAARFGISKLHVPTLSVLNSLAFFLLAVALISAREFSKRLVFHVAGMSIFAAGSIALLAQLAGFTEALQRLPIIASFCANSCLAAAIVRRYDIATLPAALVAGVLVSYTFLQAPAHDYLLLDKNTAANEIATLVLAIHKPFLIVGLIYLLGHYAYSELADGRLNRMHKEIQIVASVTCVIGAFASILLLIWTPTTGLTKWFGQVAADFTDSHRLVLSVLAGSCVVLVVGVMAVPSGPKVAVTTTPGSFTSKQKIWIVSVAAANIAILVLWRLYGAMPILIVLELIVINIALYEAYKHFSRR